MSGASNVKGKSALCFTGFQKVVGYSCRYHGAVKCQEIQRLRTLTDKPFGVNFPLGHLSREAFVDVALIEQCPVISITGGNPESLLRRIQRSGVAVKTMVLVAGTRAARKAEALGADAVIAVGFEGGGHLGRDDVGSMVLIPRIVEEVEIPVLASGGIADGRGLVAALALGAQGIELGTRFVAVQESNAHPAYQQALVRAQETDTVIIERSIGRPARTLKGPFTDTILQLEQQLEHDRIEPEERLKRLLPFILGKVNTRSALEGKLDEGFVWAGQVVGLIHDIPSTQELIERIVREAQDITQHINKVFS